MKVDYVFQDINDIPGEVPIGRIKPWGRISFYGDFLYPLAKDSTLEKYYKEAAEGVINDTLLACRKEIWEAVRGYSMKLICLSPAEFIHFGTTKELLQLVTKNVEDYSFLV